MSELVQQFCPKCGQNAYGGLRPHVWTCNKCFKQTTAGGFARDRNKATKAQEAVASVGTVKSHVPTCPTCGSTNVERITGENVARVLLVGVFALPKDVSHWSLSSIRLKLIRIGARKVSHSRMTVFQMAEVAFPEKLFLLDAIDNPLPGEGMREVAGLESVNEEKKFR